MKKIITTIIITFLFMNHVNAATIEEDINELIENYKALETKLENIEKTVIIGEVNGEKQEVVVEGGLLDIGIIDTMKDLEVNFLGAVVFSILGYIYIKQRGKGNFIKNFIPRLKHHSHAEKSAEE